jgi:hypothetical protein
MTRDPCPGCLRPIATDEDEAAHDAYADAVEADTPASLPGNEAEIVPDGEGGAWAAPSVRDVNCDTSQAMLETMVGVRGKELARRCTRRLAAEWRNRILESTKRVG